MVRNALQTWDIAQLDFLFIENVGNLVYPSSYDSAKTCAWYSHRLRKEKISHSSIPLSSIAPMWLY
jgi:hypothetical protein